MGCTVSGSAGADLLLQHARRLLCPDRAADVRYTQLRCPDEGFMLAYPCSIVTAHSDGRKVLHLNPASAHVAELKQRSETTGALLLDEAILCMWNSAQFPSGCCCVLVRC